MDKHIRLLEILHAMSTNKTLMRLLWVVCSPLGVAALLWAIGFLIHAIAPNGLL